MIKLKKFLFITHLSPVSIRSSLRQELIETMQQSLYNQSYTHWKALWIGEKEFYDGKIKEVQITQKGDLSLIYQRKDVLDYINDCDYIIKLDDDDIILPNTLEIASKLDFDIYCDKYHTFYDISSGYLTQQKRHWIASTCIHKKDNALTHQNGGQRADNFINSIFYGEHGKDWIAFYKNKKIVYANKDTPVYVRVLSPTSITAGAKIFPVKSINDIDITQYYKYLKHFGAWNQLRLKQFEIFRQKLQQSWESFARAKQIPIQGISMFQKLKSKIKSYLHD